jgi:spectrin beta
MLFLGLDEALVYQNLKRDADELKAWIADKKRIAQDDTFKNDPSSLDRRLLKHEAFIAELKANGAQLKHISQEGQALIAQQHFESPQIAHILEYLNDEWQQLSRLVDIKVNICDFFISNKLTYINFSHTIWKKLTTKRLWSV